MSIINSTLIISETSPNLNIIIYNVPYKDKNNNYLNCFYPEMNSKSV